MGQPHGASWSGKVAPTKEQRQDKWNDGQAEFFREHPERKPGPDWRWQKVDWAALRPCHPERSEGSPLARPKTLPVATWFIPPDIVLRSVRQDRHSDFVTFMLSILNPVVVEDLVRDYQLG